MDTMNQVAADWIVTEAVVSCGMLHLRGVNANRLGTIDELFAWQVNPEYVKQSEMRYDFSTAKIDAEAHRMLRRAGVNIPDGAEAR